MEYPTLTASGLVHCPPDFFDHWIIDHTLSRGMDRFSDPSHTSMEWRLRVNGAALAADVVAANFDWDRVSSGLMRAALEQGVQAEASTTLLAEAWSWGFENPTPWMIVPRVFVWDQTHGAAINVVAGTSHSREDFDRRLDRHCPLPGFSMAEFLIAEDLIYRVEATERDPAIAKQFFIRDDLLIFNYA